MKSTRLATLCVALGFASFLTLSSRAAVYNDADNDTFTNGDANLDITSVEVTNGGVNLVIAVTTRGFASWTKYLIWIDTPAKANAAANSNGWGRPASMAAGEGADFFIGSWVDATPSNVQLWEFSSAWNQHSSSPLTNQTSGNTVTFTIPLSTLGLSAGNVIKFDVATSGGGNDPGVDHASLNTSATTGWGSPSTGGPMLSYTITAPADSDGDGLADTWENTYFSNLDQTGSGDPDSDNLNNAGELAAGTNPTVADTDSDGLNDGAEVNTHTTNPTVADTDGDGVNDGAEITAGTNPKKTNFSTITVAGTFQGWSPTPTNNPSNVMTRVSGDEFGWELNFRMSSPTNHVGKFVNGTSFSASNNVNWGTSGTPGVLQLGGYANDIPFNVTATGIWRFYFNTDTLAYTFARATKPGTYAAWATAMGVTGVASDDDDSDGLTNQGEYDNDSDPLSNDTDGDGLTDNFEVTGFNNYSIATSPITPDTDGDGLRDNWELEYGLDPTDNGTVVSYVNNTGLTVLANPNGATGDPDGDGISNLQEQSAGTNPLAVGTGLAATYSKMVVAGSFVQNKPDGNWDEVGNPFNTMQLVSNFTWKLVFRLSSVPTFAQFKFTTGSWTTNFGDNIPQGGVADGVGDPNGSNINALPVFTAAGYYVINFNDFSKAYSIVPLAATDSDGDSLPDEWEAYYGGYLNPKVTDLVPTTAYVAGSTTTAAEAYAAGTNPVRDTTPPTIQLAAGVPKLTWVALNGTLPAIGASDVTASDNLGTPTVTISYSVNGTALQAIPTDEPSTSVVTYTATDADGNVATAARTIVVGSTAPGYYAMNWPRALTVNTAGNGSVYGQIFVQGATPGTGAAPNIRAWVGVSATNDDPSTWATDAWTAANYLGEVGNNDEYEGVISGAGKTVGTPLYYAFRWQIGDGPYYYGGITQTGAVAGDTWGTYNQGTPPVSMTYGNGALTVEAGRLVTYAVDMGVQIFKGAFNPATNGVEVRGDFNSFSGGAALIRDGTSTIFTNTFAVGGAEGSTNKFKFYTVGTNAVGFEGGADREAVLTANAVPLNTGTNFFSGVSESRKLTLRVDMTTQIAKGNFNPASNSVSVIGSFNSFNTTANVMVPAPGAGANVYTATVFLDGPQTGNIEYKFFNNAVGAPNGGYEITRENANRTFAASGLGENLTETTVSAIPLFSNDDGVGPTLSLNGSATVNLNVGDSFTDDGATATDLQDGACTVNTVGSVNTAAAGTYTLTYTSSDVAGNASVPASVTRTVVVAAAGSTFAGWSGGATLDSANVGKYAIGGASSLTATDGVKPTSTVSGGNLVLTAIVRTDDPKLAVVGEVVTSLANYASGTSVTEVTGSATGIDQTGVPAGFEKRAFTVPQGADTRKFLRLKATLQP